MLILLALVACVSTSKDDPPADTDVPDTDLADTDLQSTTLLPTADVDGAVIVELSDGLQTVQLTGRVGEPLEVVLPAGRWGVHAWVDVDGDGAWDGAWTEAEPAARFGVVLPRDPLTVPLRADHPRPYLADNPQWVHLHDRAWELLGQHIAAGTPANGFAHHYLDESFSPQIFQWDSCFMTLFARYGADTLPVMETMDNFYGVQAADGYIGRVVDEDDGQMASPQGPSEPMINPPLFAWEEADYARLTGDVSRLSRVVPQLDAHLGWLDRSVRTGAGLYYTSMLGSGMDNAPRDAAFDGWVDITAQVALARRTLVELVAMGDLDPAVGAAAQAEADRICADVSGRLYAGGWFVDLGQQSAPLPDKTLAGVWPLVAGCATPAQAASVAGWLGDPAAFWRTHVFPSTAADSPAFEGDGHYWRGGVWAPTNYAAIAGLRTYGFDALADAAADNHLANLAAVADRFVPEAGQLAAGAPGGPDTLWELYAPDQRAPGTRWDDAYLGRGDFVGWTGLGPIAMLYEDVLGLQPDALADTLTLRVRRLDAHGLAGLRVGDQLVDVDVAARTDASAPVVVTITTSDAMTLVVDAGGVATTFAVEAGTSTHTVAPGAPTALVPAGPYEGYAVLGNGRITAVIGEGDGEGVKHLYLGDFGRDLVESGGTVVLVGGAEVAPTRTGLDPWFSAFAEAELPDGGTVTWRTFIGEDDALVVQGALVGGPAGSSATIVPSLTLRAAPDLDGGVSLGATTVDGDGLVASWSDGTRMVLESLPAATARGAGEVSLDPTAADAGLGAVGRGPDVALAIPLTAHPGETVPFRWTFGATGALARTDALADASALHAPTDLRGRCGTTDACQVASANLAAAAASRLGGAVPADLTGQFVTNGAPQLYPRDAMMVARALHAVGMDDEAREILRFWLDTTGPVPGEWYARYDARGRAVDGGSGAAFDEPEWDSNAYAVLLARDLGAETWASAEQDALLAGLDFLVERQEPSGLWSEGGIIEWTGRLPGTAMVAVAGLDAGALLAEGWGDADRAAQYRAAAGRARGALVLLYHAERDLLGDEREDVVSLDSSLFFGPVLGFPAAPMLDRTYDTIRRWHTHLGGGVQYFEGSDYGDDLFFFTTAGAAQYGLLRGDVGGVDEALDWMIRHTNRYGLAPERIYDRGQGAAPASPLSWCAAELAMAVLAEVAPPALDGVVAAGEYPAQLIDQDGLPDVAGDPVSLSARIDGDAVVVGVRTAGAPGAVSVWLASADGAGPTPVLPGWMLPTGEAGAVPVNPRDCADCDVMWGPQAVELRIPLASRGLTAPLQVLAMANNQAIPAGGALRTDGEDGTVLVTFSLTGVPEGASPYLSGDRAELGAWAAGAVPMLDDTSGGWTAVVRVARGGWITWKFMAGASWDGAEFDGPNRAMPVADPDGNGRARVDVVFGVRGEAVTDP